LKFQAVAEKTAKDARGLLYFAAPGSIVSFCCYVFCLLVVLVKLSLLAK